MRYLTEINLAFGNLTTHKLRTFLTMLGMIFGVGAVIAMLSIGAGAEKESLRIIDTMGLRNVIVKDREFKDEDLKKIRENSIGLSTRDVQAIMRSARCSPTPRRLRSADAQRCRWCWTPLLHWVASTSMTRAAGQR